MFTRARRISPSPIPARSFVADVREERRCGRRCDARDHHQQFDLVSQWCTGYPDLPVQQVYAAKRLRSVRIVSLGMSVGCERLAAAPSLDDHRLLLQNRSMFTINNDLLDRAGGLLAGHPGVFWILGGAGSGLRFRPPAG